MQQVVKTATLKWNKRKNIFAAHIFFVALGIRAGPLMLLLLKHFTEFYPQFPADQRGAVSQRPGTKRRLTAL